MSDLKGKVAVVTGASSGIGEGIALMLASKGAKVTLCGRDQGRLSASKAKCAAANGGKLEDLLCVQGDVTEAGCRSEIIGKTVETFGKLDILIPNAGIGDARDTHETTEEVYDEIMNVNLKAVFFLCQLATPELEKTKGVIVNISSIGGTVVARNALFVYSMTKAALNHMTRGLAVTLGPKGIRVNAVCPGFTETRLARNFCDGTEEGVSEVWNGITRSEAPRHPLHGRLSTIDEIVEVVAFLASKSSNFVTGECMRVDGGRSFMGCQTCV